MAKLVSKTYGDALFELALEQNELDSVAEQVDVLAQSFAENPELLKLLTHPKISKEEKISVTHLSSPLTARIQGISTMLFP